MLKTYKNLLTATIGSIFLLAASGLAFGYTITLDSKDDAGQYPTESAYLQLTVNYNDGSTTTYDYISGTDPGWDSYDDVWTYFSSYYGIAEGSYSSWELQSASDVWSDDTTVGDGITISESGLYRISISLLSEGFYYTYDDETLYQQLQVTWAYGSTMITGLGSYIDIYLSAGDWIYFWIWDTNSIDNTGTLTADITLISVPEPATFMLLFAGIAILGWMRRRSAQGRRCRP